MPLSPHYSDILQIGARNMQNFPLLKEAGRSQKPVMLKRGMAGTIDEWLNAAEYIMSEKNFQVILCERGIRTFETMVRNTLDLSAVPVVKRLSHLPVVADPSHGTGKWYLVKPLALAAMAVGAHGLIVEVHPNPDQALSDGPQSLTLESFADMMDGLRSLAEPLDGGRAAGRSRQSGAFGRWPCERADREPGRRRAGRRRRRAIRGTLEVPGDKSISHRGALMNAIAHGRATIENYLPGADCLSTLDCLRALGVEVTFDPTGANGEPRVTVEGRGGASPRRSGRSTAATPARRCA